MIGHSNAKGTAIGFQGNHPIQKYKKKVNFQF
jgi:hypothetical protein